MTPFPLDENDKWRALLGMPQLSAPALSDPSMQPMQLGAAPDLPESPSDQPDAPGQPPQPAVPPGMEHFAALAHPNFDSIGSPPQATGPDKGQLALAMFADLLLNKGRSLGPLIGTMAQGTDAVDEENYRRRMQDAKDRAQMEHLRQGSHTDPELIALRKQGYSLQAAGQKLEGDRLKLEEQRLNTKTTTQSAMADPQSDISQHMRQTAVSMGADPQAVATMTADEILKWRPQIGQAMQQERSNTAWNQRQGVRESATVATEDRAQGRVAAQSKIPGWRTSPDVLPSKETAKEARDIVDALGEVEYAANELTKLHGELGAQAKLGKLNAVIGADDAAQKVGKANLLHQKLLAGERKLQNMGVPQRYELEMLEGVEPKLTTLDGLLMAGHVYPTVASEARAQAARRLKVYGYEQDAAPQPISRETQARPDPGAFVPKGGYAPTAGDMPSDALTRPTTQPGRAHIRKPDGTTGYIPRESLQQALQLGAKEIP